MIAYKVNRVKTGVLFKGLVERECPVKRELLKVQERRNI